jgi:hypothetical protein
MEVGLLDHEHRYWRGVIVNFEEPLVHDGKQGYSAGFEFEGELVSSRLRQTHQSGSSSK